jgi:hypothetical protein
LPKFALIDPMHRPIPEISQNNPLHRSCFFMGSLRGPNSFLYKTGKWLEAISNRACTLWGGHVLV